MKDFRKVQAAAAEVVSLLHSDRFSDMDPADIARAAVLSASTMAMLHGFTTEDLIEAVRRSSAYVRSDKIKVTLRDET